MVFDEQIIGTALICDSEGRIVTVLRDQLAIAGSFVGRTLRELVDVDSADKADLFLAEVRKCGAAFDWPIAVLLDNELALLHFIGGASGTQILVVAARSPATLVHFFEEMNRLNNEQVNAIRALAKENAIQAAAGPAQNAAYEDMAHLNNELANMQRQMAQRNSELMRLNSELMIARALLERKQSELEQANTKLTELATLDGLTGVNNRRSFDGRLDSEVRRAKRYALPLSLLMCDVDHFKSLNDTFGHPEGDAVLRTIGGLLKASARTTDFVARYGGEEFAVILVETDHDHALTVGERYRQAIEVFPWLQRPITISVGLASFSEGIDDGPAFVKQADVAMYRSKERGRNRVSHYAQS